MDIEDIVNYVQKTPNNTNPNMLRNMLNNMSSSKPLIVHVSDNWTLDKTWREMYDYYLNKGFVIGLQKFNEEAEEKKDNSIEKNLPKSKQDIKKLKRKIILLNHIQIQNFL